MADTVSLKDYLERTESLIVSLKVALGAVERARDRGHAPRLGEEGQDPDR